VDRGKYSHDNVKYSSKQNMKCPLRWRVQGHVTHWKVKDATCWNCFGPNSIASSPIYYKKSQKCSSPVSLSPCDILVKVEIKDVKTPKSFFSSNFTLYGPICFKYWRQCSNSGASAWCALHCRCSCLFVVTVLTKHQPANKSQLIWLDVI